MGRHHGERRWEGKGGQASQTLVQLWPWFQDTGHRGGGFTSPSAKSTSGIGGLVGRLGFGLGLVFGSGFGLHWLGLVWFLVWFGLVSFGLVLIWVVLG